MDYTNICSCGDLFLVPENCTVPGRALSYLELNYWQLCCPFCSLHIHTVLLQLRTWGCVQITMELWFSFVSESCVRPVTIRLPSHVLLPFIAAGHWEAMPMMQHHRITCRSMSSERPGEDGWTSSPSTKSQFPWEFWLVFAVVHRFSYTWF